MTAALTYTADDVRRIYQGTNGDATKALYAHLEAELGPYGALAVNLFRASKNSERAKLYRGRDNVGAAYDTKGWALNNICAILTANEGLVSRWGWGVDQRLKQRDDPHHHVLYVDIPGGQVSFHAGARAEGPDYPGEWDGVRGQSADRICRWIGALVTGEECPPPTEEQPNNQPDCRERGSVTQADAFVEQADLFGGARG